MVGEPEVPRSGRYYWPLNPRKPRPDVRFLDPQYYQGVRGSDGKWLVPPGYWHTGIDLNHPAGGDSDCGQPVHAMTDGYVVFAGRLPVWGGVVVLRHPHAGVWTRYGHLRDIHVGLRQVVRAGEVIGTVGKMTTGGFCHLHFDVFHRQPPASEGLWGFFPAGERRLGKRFSPTAWTPRPFWQSRPRQAGFLIRQRGGHNGGFDPAPTDLPCGVPGR